MTHPRVEPLTGQPPEPTPGVGPRTGSDPNNSAQEVAVLRAEVRGLERLLNERAAALQRAADLAAAELERRLLDRGESVQRAMVLAKEAHDQRLEDRAIVLERTLLHQSADFDRRINDRWVNHRREHDSLENAVVKAEASVDKRLEGMNELRAQIDRERGSYVTRDLHDATTRDRAAQMQSNSDKLIVLTAELSGLREDLGALKSGQEWLVRLLAGAVITAVVGLMFTLLKGLPG